jgi:uncharacterized protein
MTFAGCSVTRFCTSTESPSKNTTVTDTDQGTFETLVSAWEADRESDIIARSAFDQTIRAWQIAHKNLPLLFEHSTLIVGAIYPASMHTTDEGLVVAGEVDRSTDEGKQTWRAIKSGVAAFSIGYMAESVPRKGGGREITEIDLLEVSITSTPMHPSTRALSWKSVDQDDLPSDADQKRRAASLLRTPEQEKILAIADAKASEPRARSTQPIKVKTFQC